MTPSKRRKQGYERFDINCTPEELCPYSKTSWSYEIDLADFKDGWEQAKIDYQKELKDLEEINLLI